MIRAVAFDLDGTLVDSRRDLVAAVNRTRVEAGFVPLSDQEVVAKIGHGARDLVRKSLPEVVSGERFEHAFRRFGEIYLEVCLDETRPYPGIPELLNALRHRGLPLAVVTNKPERPTRKILVGLELEGSFTVVLGGDSLPVRKPDPLPLNEAARRLGVEPTALALVGDSAVDAATAEAAGACFVQVTWGFGVAAELARYRPWLVAASAGDIAAALAPTSVREDGRSSS
ncbi:MAG: HAD-IA family hydrolase [Thermoanaerobaculia bacterium]|nr:HAD-IA family hydrolase [Thermoanaerobaculia bacterium]